MNTQKLQQIKICPFNTQNAIINKRAQTTYNIISRWKYIKRINIYIQFNTDVTEDYLLHLPVEAWLVCIFCLGHRGYN